MLNGITKNIAFNPRGDGDTDDVEIFSPVHPKLYNGILSGAGHWVKRPGFGEYRDVSSDYAINALIPIWDRFAVNSRGDIFSLGYNINQLTGVIRGGQRPSWAVHNDYLIIAAGEKVKKIYRGGESRTRRSQPVDGRPLLTDLSSDAPEARFVNRIGPYTMLSGATGTTFYLCAVGDPETWDVPSGGFFANIQKVGNDILNTVVVNGTVFHFTKDVIEAWAYVGGAAPLIRQYSVTIPTGLGAPDSVVVSDNVIYWFGSDRNIYSLVDGDISRAYKSDLDALSEPEKIYGFDFRIENIIRWFAQTTGKCFVYNKAAKTFSEDATWDHGQFERMPINSYMEIDGRAYFGDYNPTGKIFEWSTEYESDNGKHIRVFRRFAVRPSDSGHRSRFQRTRFRLKRGVQRYVVDQKSPVTGSSITDHHMTYRTRIDRGEWSVCGAVDLGAKGDNDPYEVVHGLGIGREIEYEITGADGVDFILTNVDLTVKELGV
jgi:hypothetical protein